MKGKREMNSNKKGMTALMALVLILCCGVGGTLAWLVTTSGPVENTFTPGYVTTTIKESFDGTTKSNVTVTNTGNVPAYIRAAIVVNWLDKDGNVYAETPVKGTDYTWDLNTGEGSGEWTPGSDGFYYYNDIVGFKAPNNVTGNLINSLSKKDGVTPPSGYDLQVTILAEGLQAEGWPATVTNAIGAFQAAAGKPVTNE